MKKTKDDKEEMIQLLLTILFNHRFFKNPFETPPSLLWFGDCSCRSIMKTSRKGFVQLSTDGCSTKTTDDTTRRENVSLSRIVTDVPRQSSGAPHNQSTKTSRCGAVVRCLCLVGFMALLACRPKLTYQSTPKRRSPNPGLLFSNHSRFRRP
jgi:hypothetical protein